MTSATVASMMECVVSTPRLTTQMLYCTICRSKVTQRKFVLLRCQHTFHFDCLVPCGEDQSCPLCRAAMRFDRQDEQTLTVMLIALNDATARMEKARAEVDRVASLMAAE